MPLVDFFVGAGGADGGHGNAQPYDFRYLCPLGMAVNSSEAGVLWVPLPWHNVLLSAQLKGKKKTKHSLTNISGNSDTDTVMNNEKNNVVHYFFF